MSSIAVFLVIGGATAFAALGKNTVGSKQLKSNAVTTKKIKKEAVTAKKVKKGTLTGTQINLAKLGTVPSATARAPPPTRSRPPNRRIWSARRGSRPLKTAAPTSGPSNRLRSAPVGFFKDHEGLVHLEGLREGRENPRRHSLDLHPATRVPAGPRHHRGLRTAKRSPVLIGGSNTVSEGMDLSGKVVGRQRRTDSARRHRPTGREASPSHSPWTTPRPCRGGGVVKISSMSAKIGRLLPALLVGCAMSLLVAACGGDGIGARRRDERGFDPVRSSPVPRPPAFRPPRATPPRPGLRNLSTIGKAGTTPATRLPDLPPKTRPPRAMRAIWWNAFSVRPLRAAAIATRPHARSAIDRLLTKARKEGVEVVEHGGGGAGVEEILQQIGGRQP